MFTIEQIHKAFAKVKSGADFPQFVQDLKAIGVTHYDNFVADGRTIYYGLQDFMLDAGSKYPELPVSGESSSGVLKQALKIHQQGQTDYSTFCEQAAAAGVYKWTTHMIDMNVRYFDTKGSLLVVEEIPEVS
ncbi:DUF1398 domain-containing protein [Mangrovimonas sp. YM274]|uniref:DUF1398 domain-containing protein n=1 Tax=Mangrovimonas sp. YM274 TaxID=3070660 RepID=UPI0027DC5460|nr:DUF1398 family protein [Mangrovimonas sp. YM274]WMI68823.1 DUF1398 family protein [Mangrovimonas sp. YM274]